MTFKERRGYFHLKEAALDRTMWTARYGRGFGPVVRKTDYLNEWVILNYKGYAVFQTCSVVMGGT